MIGWTIMDNTLHVTWQRLNNNHLQDRHAPTSQPSAWCFHSYVQRDYKENMKAFLCKRQTRTSLEEKILLEKQPKYGFGVQIANMRDFFGHRHSVLILEPQIVSLVKSARCFATTSLKLQIQSLTKTRMSERKFGSFILVKPDSNNT